MTEEEKKAADAAALAEAAKVAEADAAVAVLAEKDAEITKLKDERDNYKNVALKRLGKLPGDADFVAGVDESTGLTVEEQVRKALLETEIAKAEAVKEGDNRRLARENAELRLALKNQPGNGLGSGGSEEGSVVKDNVFSEAQIADLRKRAAVVKADPEKFIENAKKNFLARR
jgi:hypothetical protein